MTNQTKKPPKPVPESDDVSQLKRRIAELELENDLLKKWQRFQAEEQMRRSDS